MDFIKISGGTFTGSMFKANGASCMSFTKFLINFKAVVFRSIAGLPSAMSAVNLTEAIFHELRPGDVSTGYVTEYNQLVFNILMAACDEEALNIVLRYQHSADGQQELKMDGRRALFALMQTYQPVSTNAGNNAKLTLERTRFKQNKGTINQQITDFYINVAVLEAARDKKLETLETWAFITSAITGKDWSTFRLTMSMQKEYKDRQSFWLVDQVREYILALEDEQDISPPSGGRPKLNAAQASSDDDLRQVVSRLAATVAAITTKTETAPRVKNSNPYNSKMSPCRFCNGAHLHRDCPTLKTSSPKPPIPPRAGAVRAVLDDDTPGFLLGAVATDQDESSSRRPFFVPFLAILTGIFWFIVAYVSFMSRGNIFFQQNLHCKAVAGGAVIPSSNNGFGVDSCASEHICHDRGMFSNLNHSRSKTFEVVHGEKITSSGVGDVDLLVATTQGPPRVLTLRNVHFIPQQNMSLVSVDKAIAAQDFESPDFKNLTWKADDTCTLKLIKTNGTYMLDASVKYWSWTKSGVHKQH